MRPVLDHTHPTLLQLFFRAKEMLEAEESLADDVSDESLTFHELLLRDHRLYALKLMIDALNKSDAARVEAVLAEYWNQFKTTALTV